MVNKRSTFYILILDYPSYATFFYQLEKSTLEGGFLGLPFELMDLQDKTIIGTMIVNEGSSQLSTGVSLSFGLFLPY